MTRAHHRCVVNSPFVHVFSLPILPPCQWILDPNHTIQQGAEVQRKRGTFLTGDCMLGLGRGLGTRLSLQLRYLTVLRFSESSPSQGVRLNIFVS